MPEKVQPEGAEEALQSLYRAIVARLGEQHENWVKMERDSRASEYLGVVVAEPENPGRYVAIYVWPGNESCWTFVIPDTLEGLVTLPVPESEADWEVDTIHYVVDHLDMSAMLQHFDQAFSAFLAERSKC